jgi:hypothetical protein
MLCRVNLSLEFISQLHDIVVVHASLASYLIVSVHLYLHGSII